MCVSFCSVDHVEHAREGAENAGPENAGPRGKAANF